MLGTSNVNGHTESNSGGALQATFTMFSKNQREIPQQECDDGSIMASPLGNAVGFPGDQDVHIGDHLQSISTTRSSYYADLITELRVTMKKKRRETFRHMCILEPRQCIRLRYGVAMTVILKGIFELLKYISHSPDLASREFRTLLKLK